MKTTYLCLHPSYPACNLSSQRWSSINYLISRSARGCLLFVSSQGPGLWRQTRDGAERRWQGGRGRAAVLSADKRNINGGFDLLARKRESIYLSVFKQFFLENIFLGNSFWIFFRKYFFENTYSKKYLLKILFQKLIFWKYFCLMPLSTVSTTLCWADLDVRRPGASHTIIIRLLTVRCQRCPGPGSSCRLGQHPGTRLLVVLSFKQRFAKIP